MSTTKDPEQNNAENEEKESAPFLPGYWGDDSKTPPVTPETPKKQSPFVKALKYTGYVLLAILALIILAILIIVIVILVHVLPNPCYQLMKNSDQVPIDVGLDLRNTRILIAFPKPLRTGLIKGGTLAVCSKPLKGFDTVVMAILTRLQATSLELVLKSQSCDGLPLKMDQNDGTIKLYIADGKQESRFQLDTLKNSMKSSGKVVGTWLQQAQLRGFPTNVTIDFYDESMLTMSPPLAIGYSNFEAVQLSQIEMLPRDSIKNQCGAPAVAVKLETSLFGTAFRGLWHYLFVKFPPLSKVGVSNYVLPTSAKLSGFTIETGAVNYTGEPNGPLTGIANRNTTLAVCDLDVKISDTTVDMAANVDLHSVLTGIALNINGSRGRIERADLATSFDFRLSMTKNGDKKPAVVSFDIGKSRDSWAKLQLHQIEAASSQGDQIGLRKSVVFVSKLTIHKKGDHTTIKAVKSSIIEGFNAHQVSKSDLKLDVNLAKLAVNSSIDFILATIGETNELKGRAKMVLDLLGLNFEGHTPSLNVNGSIRKIEFESDDIQIAQKTGSGINETFSLIEAGHPNMAHFRMRDVKISVDGNYSGLLSGQILQTKLAAKSNISPLRRQISLKIVDLDTITQQDGGNSTTKPLTLTILGRQAVVVGLHQVGGITTDATFGILLPNATQLQFLAVNTTRIVVSMPISSMLSPGLPVQPSVIEIPQFAFDFDSTNKTDIKPPSIAVQVSLKDLPSKLAMGP